MSLVVYRFLIFLCLLFHKYVSLSELPLRSIFKASARIWYSAIILHDTLNLFDALSPICRNIFVLRGLSSRGPSTMTQQHWRSPIRVSHIWPPKSCHISPEGLEVVVFGCNLASIISSFSKTYLFLFHIRTYLVKPYIFVGLAGAAASWRMRAALNS